MERPNHKHEYRGGPSRGARTNDARPCIPPRQNSCRLQLERDLLRKDRALAETAALLVLSTKVAAIFNKGEDE